MHTIAETALLYVCTQKSSFPFWPSPQRSLHFLTQCAPPHSSRLVQEVLKLLPASAILQSSDLWGPDLLHFSSSWSLLLLSFPCVRARFARLVAWAIIILLLTPALPGIPETRCIKCIACLSGGRKHLKQPSPARSECASYRASHSTFLGRSRSRLSLPPPSNYYSSHSGQGKKHVMSAAKKIAQCYGMAQTLRA